METMMIEATAFNRAMGAVIRKERLARGISMEAVATHFGFSYQQEGKYELGINACSAHMIAEYAAYFGVPVADLYKRARIKSVKPAIPSPADQDATLIARFVSRIPDEELRGTVLHLARSLANKTGKAA
jgi:transcriptional regulator with XRE-family HTH domain